jgi:acyl-CoA synthetase (AMP-forming)/AMP-acid ligase II
MTANEEHELMPGPDKVLRCLGDYVNHYALENPDGTAIVFGQNRITYRQLSNDLDVWSRALVASGISKGDRLAMLCTSRPEFWTLFLAATRIGIIWVGLNPQYKRDELRYLVSDCQPKMIFSMVQSGVRDYTADMSALSEEFSGIENIVSIGGKIAGAISLEEFLQGAGAVSSEKYEAALQSLDASDPALIVYTSGTTGKPKGAVLSNHGLTWGATMQTTHLDIEKPAVVVNFPINHVACVADTCATTLVKGGKIVFQEKFDPAATLQAVEDERCSMLGGIPTMPRDGISRLREICPRLMQLYGLTESSANIVFGEEGASLDVLAESIGKPDQGVECRIVDDSGNACAVDVAGELQFRAGFLFKGYWKRPGATRDAFTADGWLKTGDIGFWREDGNIELVGRMSEMFKSGGYNVYPREIEIVIESIPAGTGRQYLGREIAFNL